MKLRAIALAYLTGLALATAAWAATPKVTATTGGSSKAPVAMEVTLNWVPAWLQEPLARAIADANDPRDRKRS